MNSLLDPFTRWFRRHRVHAITVDDLRRAGEDKRIVRLSDDQTVILTRVYDGDRVGVSAAWPSKVNARELFDLCQHRDEANAKTDIRVFVPGVGSKPYTGTPEEFIDDENVDAGITRFNTPNWSMVVWPAEHTGRRAKMVEYTGRQPEKEFLVRILGASLPEQDRWSASKVADEISDFDHSTPLRPSAAT